LARIHDAQVGEHDSALLREQLGLIVNQLGFGGKLLDLQSLFGEVDKGGTCGFFLSTLFLLPPENGLLLGHHRLQCLNQCKR
jgi:hypothetical protein